MSDATTTDLYEVTMAMSYLREGMTAPAPRSPQRSTSGSHRSVPT
ncbi:hypothetical protein [Streptomyces sp. F001]|nr:hypothetical protein [Streptomyces sp. F001]